MMLVQPHTIITNIVLMELIKIHICILLFDELRNSHELLQFINDNGQLNKKNQSRNASILNKFLPSN